VERQNGWQLAEPAGEASPYGVPPLLGRASWEADEVRNDLRAYVVEHLGDAEGVRIIDETGFLPKGEPSVGVQRQYAGTAGRVENCQVGVFLADPASGGRTFLDRALYRPRSWTEDAERCQTAGVPDTIRFATKLTLARQMIERALEEGVPARWVTSDSVYGSASPFRRSRHERAYDRVFAPARTTLDEMVAVAGQRGAMEECFETAQGECGLDQYEVRSWNGWHRPSTLSLLAPASLTVVRAPVVRAAPLPKRKRSPSGKKS
jgi:SRSO17 transposase